MAELLGFENLYLNKFSGKLSFGRTGAKWRCLAIMHNTVFGEYQMPHDLGLFSNIL